MNQKLSHRRAAMAITAVVCMAVVLLACGGKDDTEAIYELIRSGTALAEDKQVGDLMDLTVDAFIARPGGYDRQRTRGVLFAAFMHYGKFKIHYPRPQVELLQGGDSARVALHFLIVRQNQPIPGLKELYDDPRKWIEAAGEKADLYRLELALVKDGGDWMVGEAKLEGFTGTGF